MAKIYWFLGHEQFQPEDLVEHAVLAEAVGFDGVMVSDHLQPWVDDVSASGYAFSTLGAIAAKTHKIKLLTGVVTPLFRYHPALVAQAAATIDRISGGRFELGIGSGENINEAPIGNEIPNYKERSARLVESIEILRELLLGNIVNRSDGYYKVRNLKLYSPPLSKVPILLAANGPKSATLAADQCDGIITSVKSVSETIENVIDPIKITANKNVRIVASRWSVWAKNDIDAFEALKPWRGLRAPSRAISISPKLLQEEADKLPKSDILSKYSQLRSIDDVIEAYRPLIVDIGSDTICLQMTSLDQLSTIKFMGEEVLPKLRNL